MRLTDQTIRGALRHPSPADRELADADGLALRIRAGRRTGVFQIRYRYHGRPCRISVGAYPDVSLAEARERCLEVRKSVRAGVDPLRVRREKRLAERTAATFKDLWSEYLESHLQVNCTPASIAEISSLIRFDALPVLGNVPIAEITQRDIVLLVDRPRRRHALVTANRLLSAVRTVFRYGIGRGLVAVDPTLNISRAAAGGTERPRERILTADEIRRFWNACDELMEPVDVRYPIALKLLLVVGTRIGELLLAKTADFDLDRAEWTIRGETSKSRRSRVLPLPAAAVEMLRQLITIAEKTRSVYLLPTYWGRADRPVSRTIVIDALHKILQKARISGVRPHDLRRTMRSGLGELGIRAEISERMIGHRLPKLLQTYDRSDHLLEQRAAFEQWANKVTEYAAGKSADVIEMKSA
jgi:integrase